jgi:hypothetical protein
MTSFEDDIQARMRRLEDTNWKSEPIQVRPERPFAISLLTIVASIGLLAGLGGGYVIGANPPTVPGVHSAPGIFSEGQPLHCSGLDGMSLSDADRSVRAKGYIVFWQIERGDATTMSAVPPTEGSIAGGVLTDDNTVVIVVDPTGTVRNSAPSC